MSNLFSDWIIQFILWSLNTECKFSSILLNLNPMIHTPSAEFAKYYIHKVDFFLAMTVYPVTIEYFTSIYYISINYFSQWFETNK